MLAAVLSTTLVALLSSCAQTPVTADTHDADIQAVKDVETQWNKDYEAKDYDKIVAHYADDAILVAPGAPASQGKETIQKEIKDMMADPALSLKFHATRVDAAKSGDLVYTAGSYTMTMTDPATKKPASDKGSYVTVYRKQTDGSWKATVDIASSENPPAPPPAK